MGGPFLPHLTTRTSVGPWVKSSVVQTLGLVFICSLIVSTDTISRTVR